MRKKIVIAEQPDATRTVAETILRQNGYDVIAVTDGRQANEVLANGRPAAVLVGAELSVGGRPLYERIQSDQQLAGVSLLVFSDVGATGLPFPEEAIIPRPFDPGQFLDQVTASVDASASKPVATNRRATAEVEVDEELLNAALGVDTSNLRITDSKELDQTAQPSSAAAASKAHAHHAEGLGFGERSAGQGGDSGRVESIVLNDSQNNVRPPTTEKPSQPPDPTESGGLEILDNQYDLEAPEAGLPEGREHDYHWFVNEMQQRENNPAGGKKPGASQPPPLTPADELVFTEPAATLEPLPKGARAILQEGSQKDGAGVEKFIDEFKKEVEKIDTDEPESVTLHNDTPPPPSTSEWEESLESVTSDRVELFTRRLASDLAERIAQIIVSKLDSDKLLHLIKTEILNELRARKKS